jgi:hypothetical protein
MWKQRVNAVLRHTLGYQLTRPPGHPGCRLAPPRGERLLTAPVFIFSAARSGSTLLRAILGAHSQLYAPPELPLGHLQVQAQTRWIQTSLQALRLTQEDLEHMLWDRLLASLLLRSGKPTIVVKTPSNVLHWKRIASCWPDARYIFLLRHPAAAVMSLHASWNPQWHPGESGNLAEAITKGLRYMTKVEEARSALPGFTVRYEELTTAPDPTTQRLCEFLGLPFEPGMLDYGRYATERFQPGLGDASRKIRSGRIQAPAPPPGPSQIPPELAGICLAWGYLREPPERTAAAAAAPAGRAAAQQPAWPGAKPRLTAQPSVTAQPGVTAQPRLAPEPRPAAEHGSSAEP